MDNIYYTKQDSSFIKLTNNRNQINFMNTVMYKTYKSKDNIEKYLNITNLIQKYRENIKNSIQNKDATWFIKNQIDDLDTLLYIFKNAFCGNIC